MEQLGGVSLEALAATCGTPLIVYDEVFIEQQLREAKEKFRSNLFETQIVYASKAFSCGAIFEKVKRMAGGLDVVSGGELYCALNSGFPPKDIYLHGNNKSKSEMREALDAGVGTIVLDNLQEAEALAAIADKPIDVILRINPGIEAHTHRYIMTAHSDSKFGISIQNKEEINKAVTAASSNSKVSFKGFHMHIGSQITEASSFEKAVDVMAKFTSDVDAPAELISLGGGFGIRYTACDKPIPIGDMCGRIISKCEKAFAHANKRPRKILIEPGRSIVGEAGHTLYRVGFTKEAGSKKYIFVDGGMSDNIRPALYDAEYSCEICGKEKCSNDAENEAYCIAGKNCESGDILIKEAKLPPASEGDLLIMHSTGAYGYSMASNYNRLGRPAVVFVKGGKARLVIRRETYNDMTRLETNERIIL